MAKRNRPRGPRNGLPIVLQQLPPALHPQEAVRIAQSRQKRQAEDNLNLMTTAVHTAQVGVLQVLALKTFPEVVLDDPELNDPERIRKNVWDIWKLLPQAARDAARSTWPAMALHVLDRQKKDSGYTPEQLAKLTELVQQPGTFNTYLGAPVGNTDP